MQTATSKQVQRRNHLKTFDLSGVSKISLVIDNKIPIFGFIGFQSKTKYNMSMFSAVKVYTKSENLNV